MSLADTDDTYYIDFENKWIDSGANPDSLAAPFDFMNYNDVIPNVWKCPVCKAGYTWVNSTGTTLATYKAGECRSCNTTFEHCTSCSQDH